MTEIYDNGTEVNNIDKNYYDFMVFSRSFSGKYPFNIASDKAHFQVIIIIICATSKDVLYSTYPISIYGILLMFLLHALETPFEAINLLLTN